MTRAIVWIIRAISALNSWIGHVFAWASLAMVLICFTVVVQRYIFSTSFVWMQDLYVWLNGVVMTAIAGYALLRNEHVRVDIYYRPATLRTKAIVDLAGVIFFLLPFCWIVWAYGLPFVQRSWRFFEGSPNIGGLPGFFVLKTFIPAFAVLLALQGIAMALRSVLVLTGREHELPERLRYAQSDNADREVAV